jgi:hypothetical protein
MTPLKILLLGDSGTGKTGAMASLVLSGYRLFVADFDSGSEILASLVPKELFAERVSIVPLQDRMGLIKVPIYRGADIIGHMPKLAPKKADSYQRLVSLLTEDWLGLGNIYSWTPDDVLSIDSLTHFWKSTMRFVLAINNRSGQHPTLPEWGTCQGLVEDVLTTLFDDSVHCNVILTAHIDYERFAFGTEEKVPPMVGGKPNPAFENAIMRGLPSGPGSKLNPVIGTFFNHTIRTVERNKKNFILTQGDGIVALKTAAPGKAKPSYPIETGLADYFRDLGREPSK